MPPHAMNIDIKLQFQPTDMVPGENGRKWMRDVLLHGGKADDRGYSLTDCLLRRDEGAMLMRR